MRVRALSITAVLGTITVVAGFGVLLLLRRPLEEYYGLFLLQNGPSGIVLLWLARLVLARRPGHGSGRILLAIGVVHTVHVAVAVAAELRLLAAGFDRPLAQAAAASMAELPRDAAVLLWIMSWAWVPAPVLAVLLLFTFPDGGLPGRRRWPVPLAAAAAAVLLITGFMIEAWPTSAWTAANPPSVVAPFLVAGGLLTAATAAAGIAAVVARWRRADAAHRRQFRLVGTAVIIFVVTAIVTYPWQAVWVPAILVTFNGMLVAYGLALARYRLHDMEPVLGRAAVVAVLSGLVVVIYVALVAGVGGLLGQGTEVRPLPLLAVAAVALLIEPVRRRARRWVDRVLYGRDADRTEVLSRLVASAGTAPPAAVLDEVTRLLVRSTGAARAEFHRTPGPGPRPADERTVLSADVEHHGERFGELCLYATAPSDLVPDARELLADVAHTLAVVLRNELLAEQLRARLTELHASRQRLVAAHDQARRTLERDIHDGAQARLIALRLRLGAARALGGPELVAVLDGIGEEIDTAIRSLRDLARGLYPPLLEQSGLVDALRAYVRDMPVPVPVRGDTIGRYPRTVEAAVYFACLEAVQNAIRHSGATEVAIDLAQEGGTLTFTVHDDGAGFEPGRTLAGTGLVNIGDRIGAVGGHTEIESAPGMGTKVSGVLAAQPLADAR